MIEQLRELTEKMLNGIPSVATHNEYVHLTSPSYMKQLFDAWDRDKRDLLYYRDLVRHLEQKAFERANPPITDLL